MDKLFADFDRPDSAGCALGIYKDGRIVYERGYGSADLEHDVPITPDSVFYAGSVSKQFTALAAALAIKQGLFGLDDDVRRFVPELPAYEAPITVRHLIHHTSGLRDINTLVAAAGQRDEAAFDNDAVLRVAGPGSAGSTSRRAPSTSTRTRATHCSRSHHRAHVEDAVHRLCRRARSSSRSG